MTRAVQEGRDAKTQAKIKAWQSDEDEDEEDKGGCVGVDYWWWWWWWCFASASRGCLRLAMRSAALRAREMRCLERRGEEEEREEILRLGRLVFGLHSSPFRYIEPLSSLC